MALRRWEYCSTGWVKYYDYVDVLNALGAKGWELVNGESDDHGNSVGYLKRELPVLEGLDVVDIKQSA
jgi:hypothetical protein